MGGNVSDNGEGFAPEITAFTCIYCGYMAADTAGALRLKYPPNVKLIRLPCTGKVDTRYVLEAFEQGADAVYVVACPIGNCHHIHGNERAAKRIHFTKQLLDEIGIGSERLEIVYTSGGMGATFAEINQKMVDRVYDLGPSPLKGACKT
jgi:coenzyme F420-reducing hydrogenase delta subunit